jgi:DNA gyrase/topoisomerase IV subunit B
MAEDTNTYSAADIQLLEFDDAVRKRPGMYFGASHENTELATRVLCSVLGHALHPAAGVAPSHTLRARAEISADLAFSVMDDQANPFDAQGLPRLGYYGTLFGPDRWISAAAAAVSSRAVVEIWRDGRGFHQELAGLRPVGPPEELEARDGCGTRVTFELDPAYFGPNVAISTDLGSLDLHSPHCTEPSGPGYVAIRDLRLHDCPGEIRYR